MGLFDQTPDTSPSVINMTATKLKNQSYDSNNLDVWMNDPMGTGMRNTQQLNVDWEDFSKHVFFNSAEGKVNMAFDTIVNKFPFDGTLEEKTQFKHEIDGYVNWIFEQLPTNLGYLDFNGSNYISVKDITGYLTPKLARNPGQTLLTTDIDSMGFTFETWVKLSNTVDNQIIFQKADGDQGLTIYRNGLNITLFLSSSYFKTIECTMKLTDYNDWFHIAFVYNRSTTENIIGYINGKETVITTQRTNLDSIILGNQQLTIGSGSSTHVDGSTIAGSSSYTGGLTNFSGSLDELRFWTKALSQSHLNKNMNINIHSEEGLKLYYKFNEPSGVENPYGAQSIVLDSSGNAFHSTILGYSADLRQNSNAPLSLELHADNPILFPDYPEILELNEKLLLLGNHYDRNNPNLISKLVPPHYFEQAEFFEGLAKNIEDPEGISFENVTEPIPGQSQQPSRLIMMSFLMLWATFFDEIKLWIDSFSSLNRVGYKGFENIPDHILYFMAKQYDIELPNPYKHDDLAKYNLGINLENSSSLTTSLQKLNNQIWKRLIIDLPLLWRSRGTLQGLRSLFNSLAIDVDTIFEFKEFGGNLNNTLQTSLEKVNKIQGFVRNTTISSREIQLGSNWSLEHAMVLTNTENHQIFRMEDSSQTSILSLECEYTQFGKKFKLIINGNEYETNEILENSANWMVQLTKSDSNYNLYLTLIGTNIKHHLSVSDSAVINSPLFYISSTNSVGIIRFWDITLDEKELGFHAYNLTSIYYKDALTNPSACIINIQNFDYFLEIDGVDFSKKLLDISGNENHFDTSDTLTDEIFYKKKINQSVTTTNFLYNVKTNKVRVRSSNNQNYATSNNLYYGNLNELPQSTNTDDRRFSIEASIVSALNKDIVNVFSDIAFLNDYLGAPEQEYAVEYDFLKGFKDLYFERLTGKVEYSNIVEFQRWFNDNFEGLVRLFLPYTTDFLGINFVIESHLLERHKMEYKQGDVHVDIRDRVAIERVEAVTGIVVTH